MSVQITDATVMSITSLSDTVFKVLIKPAVFIKYKPGQYLQIEHRQQLLSYSIANACNDKNYELHIRHDAHNARIPFMQSASLLQKLRIRVPLGDCHLEVLARARPIIFIAGGTGFAPIKAMFEHLFAAKDSRRLELFWGARAADDLYCDAQVRDWQRSNKNFNYFPLVPEQDTKKKLAHVVLEAHPTDLQLYQIVIAGPFDMAFATKEQLLTNKVQARDVFSDAFSTN